MSRSGSCQCGSMRSMPRVVSIGSGVPGMFATTFETALLLFGERIEVGTERILEVREIIDDHLDVLLGDVAVDVPMEHIADELQPGALLHAVVVVEYQEAGEHAFDEAMVESLLLPINLDLDLLHVLHHELNAEADFVIIGYFLPRFEEDMDLLRAIGIAVLSSPLLLLIEELIAEPEVKQPEELTVLEQPL